ncbi:hypothetical protein CB1_060782025 [Camelus ferus]|nr:hypothetical protein CB1_060782025 [Camelus ferus]
MTPVATKHFDLITKALRALPARSAALGLLVLRFLRPVQGHPGLSAAGWHAADFTLRKTGKFSQETETPLATKLQILAGHAQNKPGAGRVARLFLEQAHTPERGLISFPAFGKPCETEDLSLGVIKCVYKLATNTNEKVNSLSDYFYRLGNNVTCIILEGSRWFRAYPHLQHRVWLGKDAHTAAKDMYASVDKWSMYRLETGAWPPSCSCTNAAASARKFPVIISCVTQRPRKRQAPHSKACDQGRDPNSCPQASLPGGYTGELRWIWSDSSSSYAVTFYVCSSQVCFSRIHPYLVPPASSRESCPATTMVLPSVTSLFSEAVSSAPPPTAVFHLLSYIKERTVNAPDIKYQTVRDTVDT